MNTYKQIAKDILADYSASIWIKNAIIGLECRDIVDVLNDLDLLRKIYLKKSKEKEL